jgi:hypothetical protein
MRMYAFPGVPIKGSTETDSVIVLEALSPKSRGQHGYTPSAGYRKGFFLASSESGA